MNKANNVIYKLLLCGSVILLSILLISRLFISTNFSIYESNINYIELYYFFNFYTVIAIVFLIVLLSIKFIKINNKLYMAIIFAIPVIIGIIAMNSFPYTLTADALDCYSLAEELLKGTSLTECLSLRDNYLTVYPFQYGIISLWKIIILLFKDNAVIAYRVLQIIMSGITNIYLYKIMNLFNKDVKNDYAFLLLTFLWIIPYLMAPYAYAFGIGLALAIISLYYFIKYIRNEKVIDIILSSIFGIFSIYMKMNYAVLLIAYIIYIIFINRKVLMKKIILTICTLLMLILGMNSVNIMARVIEKESLPKGVPMSAWLIMGSQNNSFFESPFNPNGNPGYYNAYNWMLAINADNDQEEMNRIIHEDFDKLGEVIAENPLKTLEFYYDKLIATWDSRDFMANIYMTGDGFFDRESSYLQDLDSGYKGLIIDQITNIATVLIFLGSTAMLISRRNNDEDNEYCIIIIWFIGGFLYHLLFETKAVYVYPYVTALLPLAAKGLSKLSNHVIEFRKIALKKKIIIAISVIVGISGITYFYNSQKFPGNVYESYADAPTEINMIGDAIYLKQDFVLEKNSIANEIELNYSGNINDDELYFMIYEQDKVLRTGIITKDNFEENNPWVKASFKSLKLKANKEYTIEVFLKGNTNDNFNLIYGDSAWANDRFIEINNETQENKVLNTKLLGDKISDFYYYQDIELVRINELYYNDNNS